MNLARKVRCQRVNRTDIFARDHIGANNTSAAVGFAPLSETERIVLATERFLNSVEFKRRHPAAGEDVKVMAVRRERQLQLTVAMAFVDRYVRTIRDYFEQKSVIVQELQQHLLSQLKKVTELQVTLNALDEPDRGLAGVYLTVLGTSAEGADGGEVGRDNWVQSINQFQSTDARAFRHITTVTLSRHLVPSPWTCGKGSEPGFFDVQPILKSATRQNSDHRSSGTRSGEN